MPDRINAIKQLLVADADVAAVVAGRVFAHELPDPIVSRMPMAVIVISAGGGPNTYSRGTQQISDQRLDIAHYHRTPDGAYSLEDITFQLLNQMLRTTVGDTVIHWARRSAGPIDGRFPSIPWPGMAPDPSAHWPRVISSYQVLAADIPVEVAP